jgi:hypothetical protein
MLLLCASICQTLQLLLSAQSDIFCKSLTGGCVAVLFGRHEALFVVAAAGASVEQLAAAEDRLGMKLPWEVSERLCPFWTPRV